MGILRAHILGMERSHPWGTEEEIIDMIQQGGRGETINTSYVESRAVYDGAMESSFRYPPHQQLLKRQAVIGETLKHRR